MPTVPKVTGPQESSTVTPGAFGGGLAPSLFQGEANRWGRAAAGAQGVAQALDVAGQSKAEDAYLKVQEDWNGYQQEYMRTRQNGGAEGLTAESKKWWDDKRAELSETLNPLARGHITKMLERARVRGMAQTQDYERGQLERAADITSSSIKDRLASDAAADPFRIVPGAKTGQSMQNFEAAVEGFREQNAKTAARKGLTDPAALEAMNRADTTNLHVEIIKQLSQRDATAAKAHFEKYKGDIDGRKYDDITKQLKAADESETAQTEGRRLADKFDYTKTGEAVKEIDDMKVPASTKKAIRAEVEHRHALQKQDADAADVSRLKSLTAAYEGGATLAELKKRPEFNAMRDGGAAFSQYVESREYTKIIRDEAGRARAEAANTRKMFGAYQAYSDPANLAAMSRDEIQLLLPTLGSQLTEHLLNRKDAMVKNPALLGEAKMDKQDLDHVADSFGLNPYANTKSEDQKRLLGEFQYRAEQLISKAQLAKKAPLTREEKMGIMQEEATRTVTLGQSWFSGEKQKPVILLDPKDVSRVKIPAGARNQIVDALQTMYANDPTNPAYAPTEENVVRLYLRARSRAAELINGQ